MDLRHESDVEQLRRIAMAQQIQIQQLMRVLSAKCEELKALKGNPQELQQTLALLNQLQSQVQKPAEQEARPSGEKQVQQQKYVCRCGGCVETAPGPERAVKGGRYSLAFAIKVALDKYLDHIPLARQQRILARHGVVVTPQTLWDQVFALGKRLATTADALFKHALAHSVIGLDQTGWPKLVG